MQQPPRSPNLFVIGAAKCGTTSLHSYLDAHSDVFMCTPKEPQGFLDADELRAHRPRCPELKYAESWDHYAQLFDRATNERFVGEASVLYTARPALTGVAERLHAFAPDARLIYLVRDPVQRSLSHYWHRWIHYGEWRDPLTAMQAESQYTALSNYVMQVEPYLRLFGRESVHVIATEELRADHAGTMASIFDWLGLPPAPSTLEAPTRKLVTPKSVYENRFLSVAKFRASDGWRIWRTAVPGELRRMVRRLVTKPLDRGTVDLAPATKYLRELQGPQAAEFFDLVGEDFETHWTTLFDTPRERDRRE